MSIAIPANLARQIERDGIAAYPNECCGILFGRDQGGAERVVVKIEPAANEFDPSGRHHRFAISPRNLIDAEKFAHESGLTVLGFYHSHPNHPARPSEFDRSRAWPFYSYLIVSILNGEAADLTSWVLDEETETFIRQDVIETG